MQRALATADEEHARWLDWVTRPSRAVRWMSRGEMWERRDGEWVTWRMVEDPCEMERDGRRPVVLGEEAMSAAAKLRASRPSQGDIDDAMRGLEPTPVVVDEETGETRTDYKRIPLKNSDGSLTKYAKRLIDLHAPTIETGQAMADKVQGAFAKAEP